MLQLLLEGSELRGEAVSVQCGNADIVKEGRS